MPNANRFWVGTGTWNATNTNNWSSVSTTGPIGASVPDATDDVYFDANSGSCTISTSARVCKNLSFVGISGTSDYAATFTVNVGLSISGGLTYSPSMIIAASSQIINFNGTGSFNIVSNGKTNTSAFSFNNPSGNWTLVDNFITQRGITKTTGTLTSAGTVTYGTTLTNSADVLNIDNGLTGSVITITGGTVNLNGGTVVTTGNVNLSGGTLNINTPVTLANNAPNTGTGVILSSAGNLNVDANLTTWRITTNGGSSFILPSGVTIFCTGSWNTVFAYSEAFSIANAPTVTSFLGTIKLTSTANDRVAIFNGGGLSYNVVWFSRGNSTAESRIVSNNIIDTLIDDGTAAHVLRFQDGSTQTILTDFNVNGNSISSRITLSSISGSPATFNLNYTGTSSINCQYLDVRNCIATPYTAPDDYFWYAEASISSGTVSGWSIINSRYWIGTTGGNWNDSTKWSAVSGSPVSASVPSSSQNAIFDSNSGSGNVVITNGSKCYGFDCSTFAGTFSGSTSLTVYQNVNLGSSFSNFTNFLILSASGRTNYINTNGVLLNSTIQIGGTGTTVLSSNLVTSNYITHTNGKFETQSYNVTCAYYINSGTTTLNMNNSIFTITSRRSSDGMCWNAGNSNLTLNAGTSSIIFTDSTNTSVLFQGGGKTYNLVHFNRGTSNGLIEILEGTGSAIQPTTFNEFKDTGTVSHTIQWDTEGFKFNIFNVNGSSSLAKITLDTAIGSSNYTFESLNNQLTYCENIIVNRCTASPSKKFYANTLNSTIGTNTTGWNDPTGGFALLGVGG